MLIAVGGMTLFALLLLLVVVVVVLLLLLLLLVVVLLLRRYEAYLSGKDASSAELTSKGSLMRLLNGFIDAKLGGPERVAEMVRAVVSQTAAWVEVGHGSAAAAAGIFRWHFVGW